MKDAIRLMLLPIAGALAIGIIFLLVVWSGHFQGRVVNEDAAAPSAIRDLAGAATITATPDCDDSYFPVCGLDGITYDNACKAVADGTKVAHRGACGVPQE